jgi:hypothetical protein
MNHTGRLCEHCAEKEANEPTVKSADMIFFKVCAVKEPKADELRELIKNHKSDYPIDLFDGREHSYIEIGGFVGDQGVALLLMGLGSILGLWKLRTPRMLPGIPEDLVQAMAGIGYVIIQAPKPLVPVPVHVVENGGAK